MQAPASFLRHVATFVLDAAEGVDDGHLIDDRPRRAAAVWAAWSRTRTAADRRLEILALARGRTKAVRSLAGTIAAEKAPNRSAAFRARLATGLGLIPRLIRDWLRRADDPRGVTSTPALLPSRSKDLLPFIPERLPQFSTGHRPFPEGERELTELLGVRRFCETWLAVNPLAPEGPPVVLKFCFDPATAEHLRGPQAAALLDLQGAGRMSGVVPLRQRHLSADPPCLEYEYVSGGDLAALTYQLHYSKAPPDAFHRLLRKIAATVGAFHRLAPPVVHGNLKPANVLVQRRDEGRVSLRIGDFSIDADRADPRADVFALGVMWYQMLLGDMAKPVPPGATWRSRLLGRGIAGPVLEVLQECLDEDPDRRLPDTVVLAERIDALLRLATVASAAPPAAAGSGSDTVRLGEVRRSAGQWFVEGNRCLEHRQLSAAVKAFDAAQAAGYDAAAVCRQRAMASTGRRDFARAADDLNRLVAERGTDIESYLLRGEFFLTTGRIDEAIVDFSRARQIDRQSARVYIGRGRACLAKGEYDLALVCFDKAQKRDARSTDAFRFRGDAWLGMGDADRAFAEYTAAVRAQPRDASLYHARGDVCLRQDRADQALSDFTEAIRLDRTLAAAYHSRGRLFMRLAEFDDALMDLNQALRLDRRNAAAYRDRAEVRLCLGKRRLAKRDFERAVKRGRRDPQSYLARGRFRALLGRHRDAVADFTRALRLDPNCAEAVEARAKSCLVKGKLKRAVHDLTKAIALRPDSVEARLDRARAFLAAKQYSRAQSDAEEVLRREPGNTAALALLKDAEGASLSE
jgi:tetratricopeptide (TPR) repeat protein